MNTHVPLRSILLATNLTDIDWLFPFTCTLAEESGAHVKVLHVVSSLNGFSLDLAGTLYYHPDEAIAEATKQLKASCCHPCAAKVHSEIIAIDGASADGILATARQMQADLIVMGTRAYRGVDKWLHGSVAETVLRSSPIPVIVVGPHARRTAASGRPIKSILYATSLKAKLTDAENIRLAFNWAERLHGHLTLLHVVPNDQKDKLAQERNCEAREAELRTLLPPDAFRTNIVDAHVRTGRASREILTASAEADLITLGALGNPLLGRLAPEGTLCQVLAEAHCPVATLHSDHAKPKPHHADTHSSHEVARPPLTPTASRPTPAGPATR
jgi:nucleotide-binding universal stress UspA family protein